MAAFGCFGGDFRMDNELLLFCSHKMSDTLSDKSLARRRRRTKRRREVPARAGVTPRNFWADRPQKSGVAPARFSLFSTVTFLGIEFCMSFVSKKFLATQGDETGEEEGGGCNPYFLHPSFSASRSRAPTRRSNSVPKCTVTGWSAPPNSWRMSSWVTRPAFHSR